jgi:hypothetical protein
VATLGGSDAALGFFGAKAEMVRLSGLLTAQFQDSVRGLKRYDRNQRLLAAHAVLAVTALFEALDDLRCPGPARRRWSAARPARRWSTACSAQGSRCRPRTDPMRHF